MAYAPKLSDIQPIDSTIPSVGPSSSYTPKLSDIKPQQSFLSRIGTGVARGMSSLFDPAAIGTPVPNISLADTTRVPRDILAGLGKMGEGILETGKSAVGALSPSLAAHIPTHPGFQYGAALGIKKPSLLDTLIQGATQYAPYALGGEALGAARGAGILGRMGAQAVAGGAFGGTQVPSGTPMQDRELSALIGAGVGGAGELAGAGISALSPTAALRAIGEKAVAGIGGLKTPEQVAEASKLVGDAPVTIGDLINYGPLASVSRKISLLPLSGVTKDAATVSHAIQEKAAPALQDMLGESTPETVTDDLKSGINQIYNNNRQNTSDMFERIMNDADSRRISAIQRDAYGIPKSGTNLQKTAKSLQDQGTVGLNSGIQNNLETFANNPAPYNNFQDAHNLNSFLGKTYRNLVESQDFQGARIVSKLQNALQEDLSNSLSKSGHQDLIDAWEQARDAWKNNVVPFRDTTLANKLAGKTTPQGLHTALMRGTTDMNSVVSQLPQDLKNKIAFHFIKDGTKKDSIDEITPMDVARAYNKMSTTTRNQLLTPEQSQNRNELNALIDSSKEARLSLAQPATGFRNRELIKALALAGVAGGAGLGVVHGVAPEILASALGVSGIGRGIQKALTSQAARDMYINAANRTGLLESLGGAARYGLPATVQPQLLPQEQQQ